KHSWGSVVMTPRPAPGAERVVAVLNFLTAHPDESFTLSELARRLGLNKATCHALLMTLTEAGYVLRHPTRMTYMLGPALVAAGTRGPPRTGSTVTRPPSQRCAGAATP